MTVKYFKGAYGYSWRYALMMFIKNYDKEELERNKYAKTGKWGGLFTLLKKIRINGRTND